MELIILGSILMLRVVQKITGKTCSKMSPIDSRGMVAYLGLKMGLSALTAIIALVLGGVSFDTVASLPVLGWTISIATGLALTVSNLCLLLSMRGASVVLSSLFSTAGLLVPTLAGIVLFNQQVTWGQWLGILCLFGAALLLSSASKNTNGTITWKTLLYLVGSMITNGSIMLLQTLYRAYVPTGNVSLYSFLQFGIPAVILIIVSLAWSWKNKEAYPRIEKKLLGHTILASATLFAISQISTIASAAIPAAVLFPISDGGGTVIAAIVAAVFFKEKLTLRSTAGVLVGVIGIAMIKLLSGT